MDWEVHESLPRYLNHGTEAEIVVFDQVRKARCIPEEFFFPWRFTDCTHGLQNVIVPLEKVTAWRVRSP